MCVASSLFSVAPYYAIALADITVRVRDICVASAGRSPSFRAASKPSKRAKEWFIVYAVERNPDASVTCVSSEPFLFRSCFTHSMGSRLQGSKGVGLISGDMRQVPEPGDIVVNELLGSLSDSEHDSAPPS